MTLVYAVLAVLPFGLRLLIRPRKDVDKTRNCLDSLARVIGRDT